MSAVRELLLALSQSAPSPPSACSLDGDCGPKHLVSPSNDHAPESTAAAASLPRYRLPESNPQELGNVTFLRSLSEVGNTDKPIFLQFQEIPGCHTCTDYGDNVLLDPLVVELLETVFTPVVVHNNSTLPSDVAALKQFNEPTWNNPVVHVLDPSSHEDLVPRVDGIYDLQNVLQQALQALVASQRSVPSWVDYVAIAQKLHVTRDADNRLVAVKQASLASTTFVMECYWAGETVLGGIDGVVSTLPGWIDGVEVVEVSFDETATSYSALLRAAVASGLEPMVHTDAQLQVAQHDAVDGVTIRDRRSAPNQSLKVLSTVSFTETKYHLRTKLPLVALLPLTPLQEAHAHTLVARRHTQAIVESAVLTPRQVALLRRLEAVAGRVPHGKDDAEALHALSPADRWKKLLQAVESAEAVAVDI